MSRTDAQNGLHFHFKHFINFGLLCFIDNISSYLLCAVYNYVINANLDVLCSKTTGRLVINLGRNSAYRILSIKPPPPGAYSFQALLRGGGLIGEGGLIYFLRKLYDIIFLKHEEMCANSYVF